MGKTILEQTEMLAQFLGCELLHGRYFLENVEIGILHYDGLMRLVEKIEDLGYTVTIVKEKTTIADDEGTVLFEEYGCLKQDSIFSACVAFVEWYNEVNS